MRGEPVRLLVIDDNPNDVELLKVHLEESRLPLTEIMVSGDLDEGIRLMDKASPDCVFLDLGLSGHHGLETLKRVDPGLRQTPVIVLTGHLEEDIGVDAIRLGAQDFLAKDRISPDVLQRVVRYAIARRGIENELRITRERLELVLEGANLGFYDWMVQTGEVHYGDRWMSMLGYQPGELDSVVGTWESLLHPDDSGRVRRALKDHIKGGSDTFNAEFRMRNKKGDWQWIQSIGKVIERDGEGKALRMSGIHIDITERKVRELVEEASKENLRHIQKMESIGTLASGVAHEINNPVGIMMNYAQLILDEAGEGGAIGENASEIVKEGERVAVIVRDLLRFSRQDKQSHSSAKVEDIIVSTLRLVRKSIEKDGIGIQVDLEPDMPSIKCRSQQIQQVLMNLLLNARDALNERYEGSDPDKTIRVEGRVFARDSKPWVRISVRDRGAGIPDDVVQRIFDPFFTTKPRDIGTGLGLSISHGIIREHHGEIRVETGVGTGTSFHVELPVDNGWSIGDHDAPGPGG